MERRRHPRTELLKGARVSWAGDGAGLVSLLSDLSVSGLYIETPSPVSAGEALALMFESPGKAIQARAIVRRCDPGRGMGVEFVEMSEDDRRRVVSLIQAALQRDFALRTQGTAAASPMPKSPGAAQAVVPKQAAFLPEGAAESIAESVFDGDIDITEELVGTGTEPTKTAGAAEEPTGMQARDPALRPHTPPSKQSPSERRGQVRLIIPATAEIKGPASDQSIRAAVGNIGRQGCYIKTERNVPVGTNVSVHIIKGKFSFVAEARVVHAFAGKGFGLMFTAIEPDNLATFEAWLQSSHEHSWWNESRRRSQRLTLAMPVTIAIKEKTGKPHVEKTTTVSISPQGASVLIVANVEVGQHVEVTNPQTTASAECRVVYKGNQQEEKRIIGLAFALPNRAFWKVAFPPSDWSQNHPEAKRQNEPDMGVRRQ